LAPLIDLNLPGFRRRRPIEHPMTDVAAQLHAEHRLETTRLQTAVDRVTALVGWPGFVVAVMVAIVIWVAANLLAVNLGVRPADPPPFVWLQETVSAGALLVAALILTTQRREDQLASHRAQMILELAVINDQKLSKIIALLEENRRDNPALRDRLDSQAIAMSTPADTRAVLDAIKEVQGDLDRTGP
jgi:uncharacterized membrane protein